MVFYSFKPYGNDEGVHFKAANNDAYRPSMEYFNGPLWLRELIVQSWSGDALLRPTFPKICEILKKEALEKKDIVVYAGSEEESATHGGGRDLLLPSLSLSELKRVCSEVQEEFSEMWLKRNDGSLLKIVSDEELYHIKNDSFIILK